MGVYEGLVTHKEKLALIGLGYVGMPIAIAFAKKIDVIGFDNNPSKIALYKSGIDPTKEVGDEAIKRTTLEFTYDEWNDVGPHRLTCLNKPMGEGSRM